MRLFMTTAQLHERDRLTRLEGTLGLIDNSLIAHKEDCLDVRRETKDELSKLNDTIVANHEDWKTVVADMDRANIKRLRWANGLLMTILLSLAGFLGEQVWSHTMHESPVAAAPLNSNTRGH